MSPGLPDANARQVLAALRRAGFVVNRDNGCLTPILTMISPITHGRYDLQSVGTRPDPWMPRNDQNAMSDDDDHDMSFNGFTEFYRKQLDPAEQLTTQMRDAMGGVAHAFSILDTIIDHLGGALVGGVDVWAALDSNATLGVKLRRIRAVAEVSIEDDVLKQEVLKLCEAVQPLVKGRNEVFHKYYHIDWNGITRFGRIGTKEADEPVKLGKFTLLEKKAIKVMRTIPAILRAVEKHIGEKHSRDHQRVSALKRPC